MIFQTKHSVGPAASDLAQSFVSLFRGRDDYIARQNGTGFAPARVRGGVKAALLDERHLAGAECMGFYVLTSDSRCFVTALDFDNKSENTDPEWKKKVETVYFDLVGADLPPLVEISQSGKAAHLWLFFREAVDAWLPRAFWHPYLKSLGVACPEIFPKQKRLGGKGFGNLIRFPLWRESRFVDVEDDWSTIDPLEALRGVRTIDAEAMCVLAAERGLGELRPSQDKEPNEPGNDLSACVERLIAEEDSLIGRRWRGDAEGLKDKTRSGVAMSLVCELIRLRVPTREVETALRQWCELHGVEKGERDDWVERTVAKGAEYAQERKDNCRAPKPDATVPAVDADLYTELAFSERLVDRHADKVRYNMQFGWLRWDGTRWKRDDIGRVETLAKNTIRAAYSELADIDNTQKKKVAFGEIRRMEYSHRIRGIVKLAESDPRIRVATDQLDRDPLILNCLNGTLDLRTSVFQTHRQDDLLTKCCGAKYDEKATAPRFERFLDEIFDGNTELIEFMQRVCGYALSGLTIEQCLFLLFGTGANGKSVFLKVMQTILGDYAAQCDSSSFMVKRNDSVRNDIARLKGVRLVASVETDEGRRMAESLVKQLTGGDKVTARFLFHEYFEFDPEFKLFIAANHKPEIRGRDHAIWRRIRLIPFTVTIPENERNPKLAEELLAERSGILNWMLTGCLDWQDAGLRPPEIVTAATDEYRAESDVIGAFLDECCVTDGGGTRVSSKDLWDTYVEFSGDKRLGKRKFNERLRERGYTLGDRSTGGKRFWDGLQLQAAVGE